MDVNKHYILADNQGRIIDGYSDAFPQNKAYGEEYTLIAENVGRQFVMLGKTNPSLFERGVALYKKVSGEMLLRSQAELDAELAARPPQPPSTEDKINLLTEENERHKQEVVQMNNQNIDLWETLLNAGVL